MADPETNSETEKEDDFVFDPKTGDYKPRTISPELYKQQKKAQTRQATTAGIVGLGAELAQFAVGTSIFSDPTIKAAGQEKARLKAELEKGPDLLSESEKQERRSAALAPIERQAEAAQRRAEAVMASTGQTGNIRGLLAAGDVAAGQVAQQQLETEAAIAAEDVRRGDVKKAEDEETRARIDSIDAMMLDLRNKYIREPLHKFIADAGKVTGTLLAYAPARTIDNQVARLREAGVPEDKISEFVSYAEKNPGKNRKVFRDYLNRDYSQDTTTAEDTTAAPAAPTEPVPVMNWKDTSPGKYGGVEYRLGEDNKIRYNSPDTGREIVVEPGTKAYEAIMEIRPEPEVPEAAEQALTPDQIKEKALEAQESAQLEQRVGETVDEAVPGTQSEFLFGEDPLAGGPAQRNQQRVKEIYEKKQEGGVFGGPLYQKGSYLYEYDKERGVWTVYTSRLAYATRRPLTKDGTKEGEPVQFTMQDAIKSNNSNVRELYDLAMVEGLVAR